MMNEPFERARHARVIGIQWKEQAPARLPHAMIEGHVLAAVGLPAVSDGETRTPLPCLDESPGIVGRAVIHNEPLEITERLAGETFVDTMQRVSTVVGRSEHREGMDVSRHSAHPPPSATPCPTTPGSCAGI